MKWIERRNNTTKECKAFYEKNSKIENVIEATILNSWHRPSVANVINIGKRTLYRWMKNYREGLPLNTPD